MDNLIKIKTSQTDALIEAVLSMNKDIHIAVYEHRNGNSSYIITTESIQKLFELGAEYGYQAALLGGHPYERATNRKESTRGKGNEKKHPDEVGRKALAKVSRK